MSDTKPPLGVKPLCMVIESRISELARAISRYQSAIDAEPPDDMRRRYQQAIVDWSGEIQRLAQFSLKYQGFM